MTDLFAPVKLPQPVFQELVRQIDLGIAQGQVMLVLHEDFPYRELSVLDENALHIGGMTTDEVVATVDTLDQLLVYAFEHAPDDIVTKWATNRDESLAEEARSKVEFLRQNMPNLRGLWESKSESILPPLVSFAYEPIYDAKGSGAAVAIYMSAARVNEVGAPDSTDAIRLRMQLWPGDVNMLIKELEHVRDAHLQTGTTEGNEDDEGPRLEAASSHREETTSNTLPESQRVD